MVLEGVEVSEAAGRVLTRSAIVVEVVVGRAVETAVVAAGVAGGTSLELEDCVHIFGAGGLCGGR